MEYRCKMIAEQRNRTVNTVVAAISEKSTKISRSKIENLKITN